MLGGGDMPKSPGKDRSQTKILDGKAVFSRARTDSRLFVAFGDIWAFIRRPFTHGGSRWRELCYVIGVTIIDFVTSPRYSACSDVTKMKSVTLII